MSEDKALAEAIAAHHDDYYRRQVGRVAQRYRDLADQIERDGLRVRIRSVSPVDDQVSYVDAAADVVKGINVTIMNSGVEGLLRAAADADYWLRRPQEGPPA